MDCLTTAATVSFNPVEYSGVEGDGQLMVCVQVLTTAISSQSDFTVFMATNDSSKTGTGLYVHV